MPKPSRGFTPLAAVCLLFASCATPPHAPSVAIMPAPGKSLAAISGGGRLLVLSWPLHQIPPTLMHSAAECQTVQAAVLESATALPDLVQMIRSGAFSVQCDLMTAPRVRT